MKKYLHNLRFVFTLFLCVFASLRANSQQCEYTKAYFGADFGVSVPSKIYQEQYKTHGLRIRSYQMAMKAGIRFIPYNNCDAGNKYLVEFEARGDRWQNGQVEGTFITLAGGIERWIGDKGYVHLLAGLSVPVIDSVGFSQSIRPYAALRIGRGQLYVQPVIMPRINQKSFRPTMIDLTIGFKAFSYAGVRFK